MRDSMSRIEAIGAAAIDPSACAGADAVDIKHIKHIIIKPKHWHSKSNNKSLSPNPINNLLLCCLANNNQEREQEEAEEEREGEGVEGGVVGEGY